MSWAVADDPSHAAAAIANLRIYTSPFRAGWHCLFRKGRIGLPAKARLKDEIGGREAMRAFQEDQEVSLAVTVGVTLDERIAAGE